VPYRLLTLIAGLPLSANEDDDHNEDEEGHDASGDDRNNDDDVCAADSLQESNA